MPELDLGSVIGPQGEQGIPGPQGPAGPQGIPGEGFPVGGTTGQVLTKGSDQDYDTEWKTLVAADVGARPNDWLPTATEVGASSNRNLLDNWYFIGGGSQQGGGQLPINQRGQTEYLNTEAEHYIIDRFTTNRSTVTLATEGVYIKKASTSSYGAYLSTPLEKGRFPSHGTVTFSVLYDNTLVSIVLPDIGNIETWPSFGISSAYSSPTLVAETYPQKFQFLIYNPDSTPICIKAMKVELGSVQTLAHQDADGNWVLNDPPPNYALELTKCQRYQMFGTICADYLSKYNEVYRCFLPLPVTLRGTPTVVGTPNFYSVATDLTVIGPTVLVHEVTENGVLLDITGATQPVYVWFATDSGVDANL